MLSKLDTLSSKPEESSDVMVVLCSENHAAADLLAACEPTVVLQTFGGIRNPSDASTRATFEYGIRLKGVRRVVVCGHLGCRAAAGRDPRAQVVEQCQKLEEDAHIGPLLREHGVTLQALWFDPREGCVYTCSVDGRASTLLRDHEFKRIVEDLRQPLPA